MEKEKKVMDKEKKKRIIKLLIFSIVILLLVTGFSLAALNLNIFGKEANIIKSGCLQIKFTETAGLNLTSQVPITDEEGKEGSKYTFTIENICSLPAYYYTTFNLINNTNLENASKVKLYMEGDSAFEPTLVSSFGIYELDEIPNYVKKTYLIDKGYLAVGETKTFDLRMWIDLDVTSFIGDFDSKIIISSLLEPKPTDEACFAYTQTATEITITDYKCYAGNSYGLPTITDVVIPSKLNGKNVVAIADKKPGASGFYQKGITSVIIPNTMKTIGEYTFSGNNISGTVIIPNSVTSMGRNAFASNRISDIVLGSGLTLIPPSVFENNILTDLTIPDTIASIGSYAFLSNQIEGTIVIPDSVKIVDFGAFSGNQITNVILGNNIVTIGHDAFQNNKIEGTVVIPDSVETIDYAAFQSNNITSVIIGNNVTTIERSVFQNNNLTGTIIIPASVKTIGHGAFHKTSTRNVNLTTIINLTGNSFDWGNIIGNYASPSGYVFVTGTVLQVQIT